MPIRHHHRFNTRDYQNKIGTLFFYLFAFLLTLFSTPLIIQLKDNMKFSIALFLATAAVIDGFSNSPSFIVNKNIHESKTSSSLFMTVEENTNQKNIKVGVIGCGRIGLVHLEAITKAPNVTPVIVSNPTVSKAEAGKLKHSQICYDL